MYSVYNLNKQGDYIQTWYIPFPIWNQSVVSYPVLIVASWPAYRWSKVIWYSHLLKNFPQFVVIHTVKGFGIVNKADVLLELSCFFSDPTDVGNLISGSSAFSKSSLYIWKFSFHVLLKPNLKDFEHYFASMCSVQFSSVAQSCPTLCNPMNRSMPGLPVHHQLPEFTQTHVHQVSDATCEMSAIVR